MEAEITMEELVELINNQKNDFIIEVLPSEEVCHERDTK